MAIQCSLVTSILLSCLVVTSYGVSFSSLQQTLIVTASPQLGQVLKAGEDQITLTWSLNTTYAAGIDLAYKTIKVKLCYALISQKDREWRKTEDDLAKDKTCQHEISLAYNSADEEVSFGQTTDYHKTTSLLEVQAISGRTVPLDIASICFSVFSIASLFGFYLLEKKRARTSPNRMTS
ncbi:hypothetical protein ACJIZ3_009992 [Penstemon smallii]|uniref:High-affinity nitrate transporter n=1 Tax=Penstemon smallii TaxID=265156 RepID=A0ABD3TF67_9LAMI